MLIKLLQVPADLNVNKTSAIHGSMTALHVATVLGYSEIVGLLLRDPRLDVNVRDGDGNSALLSAVRNRHVLIAEMLLVDPRIEKDVVDVHGSTALHNAIESNYLDMVTLLARFLDLTIKNRFGEDSEALALRVSYEVHGIIIRPRLSHVKSSQLIVHSNLCRCESITPSLCEQE
jgi:ankyrin repeat protein